MASILKHLRSSTADKRPTASGLADGQIAINTASGTPAMFFKDNAGNIIKVGPAHVGIIAPNASPAGSAGNSEGELWIDENLSTRGLKYYDGTTFLNLTPSGTTTTVGLVELATDAETQTGTDNVRAVTPSGLQSKISDSTSTTSSITIASSTAVKSAYDLANAALPKAGGTLTGELLISPSGSLVFEGSSDDSFETTIAVTNPTADRTITFPNVTGHVVTTGDSGTVTSTMIADGTIVNADINSAAAIAHSKLANITAGSVLLGNASNAPTATALSGDVTINSSGVTAISPGVIVNADISASAAIVDTKLDTIATADKVSLSALNIDGATDIGSALVNGDLFIVDDGAGGTNRKAQAFRMAQLTYSGVTGDITVASGGTAAISSGVIVNADVSPSAAIAGTKISPDFGSQNVITTGTVTCASLSPTSSTVPTNGIYLPSANSVGITTSGTSRLQIDSSGTLELAGTAGNSISINGTASANCFSVDGNGNIGIGTAAAVGAPIDIVSHTGPAIRLGANNGAYFGLVYGASYTADEHFFYAPTAGYSYYKALVTGPNGTPENVFNDDGANLDFRVEGDANAHLFFVDASTDRVGIGTPAPQAPLHVVGITDGDAVRISQGGQVYKIGRRTSDGALMFTGLQTNFTSFRFGTDGNEERVVFDSSGRVGIGTTSPAKLLEVQNTNPATDGFARISSTHNGAFVEFAPAGANTIRQYTIGSAVAGSLIFYDNTASTQRAAIDSGGRLLVGTSSTINGGFNDNGINSRSTVPQLQVAGNDWAKASATFATFQNAAGVFSQISFNKSRNATVGTIGAALSSGDAIGGFQFAGSDSAKFLSCAAIEAYADGGFAVDSAPGRIVFKTNGGTANLTERMRLTSTGALNFVGAGSSVSPAVSFNGSAPSNSLVVDSSGNVGVKTTNATAYGMNLAVVGTIGLVPSTQNTIGSSVAIKSQLGSSGGEEIVRNEITSFVNGANYGTATIFATRNGATTGEQLRITSDRYVRLASGTGGIQFNGDTAAANALDDYEEGTWTPQLEFGGATTGITYNGRQGYYVKIGKMVFITVYFNLSSKGTATGNSTVTGLPFTSEDFNISGTTSWPGSKPSRRQNQSASDFAMTVQDNTTTILVTDGAGSHITNATFTNGTIIECALLYRAAT